VSTLEDRVRAAFRADAETVRPETIPGVPEPGTRRGLRMPWVRLAGTRSKTVRWLAPVAAVLAVIGVIAGVSLVARPEGQSSSRTPTSMPPYYVTLTGAMVSQRAVLTAAVRDSATGALLTTVNVPVGQNVSKFGATPPMPSGITASANGRTFAITDDLGFFLLRVAPGGRSARLSRLPIHVPFILSDTAALSPDGSQLAIDVEPCANNSCREALDVVSLATGASKIWNGPSVSGSPLSPAWVGGGTEIMFLWQVGNSSTPQGYRLLNVSGPVGSLLGLSRPMVSPPAQSGSEFPGAILTPDGRGLITTDYRNVPGQDGGGTAILRVVERSASTGRLLRVLHTATEHYSAGWVARSTADAGCQVLSLGATGLHALVKCPGLGRLDDDRFTALPGVPVSMNGGTGIGGTAAW
jgi:hypothetical protein